VVLATPAAWAATARVQYVSSASVYLDAGRGAGLVEGATVQVQRQGQTIAELLVEFVAENSAACKLLAASQPLRAGDAVVFTPAPAAPAGGSVPGGTATGSTARPTARAARQQGVFAHLGSPNGTIVLGYLQSDDPAGTYRNPALRADLRWEGSEREQLALRLRGDRPQVDPEVGETRSAVVRLYEGSLRYRSRRERFEVDAGRTLPLRLETMGYVDGASVRWRPAAGLRLGVVGGGGSDIVASEFGTRGWKLGGFLEAHDARRAAGPARWRALAGAVRLEDPGITRRQFVVQRADAAFGRRARASQYLELEVNPGWKRARGEPRTDVATLSVSTQIAVHRRVDLAAGFDRRHDPLLPEARVLAVLPERLRTTGVQGSARLQLGRGAALRLGADYRFLPDGTRRSRAWDAIATAGRLGTPDLDGVLHAGWHDTDLTRSTLVDGSLAWQAKRWVRLEIAAGSNLVRTEARPGSTPSPDERSTWLRSGLDLQMGRGLWLDVSGEWRGGQEGSELFLQLGRAF
jgi:hypothetical protein